MIFFENKTRKIKTISANLAPSMIFHIYLLLQNLDLLITVSIATINGKKLCVSCDYAVSEVNQIR